MSRCPIDDFSKRVSCNVNATTLGMHKQLKNVLPFRTVESMSKLLVVRIPTGRPLRVHVCLTAVAGRQCTKYESAKPRHANPGPSTLKATSSNYKMLAWPTYTSLHETGQQASSLVHTTYFQFIVLSLMVLITGMGDHSIQ